MLTEWLVLQLVSMAIAPVILVLWLLYLIRRGD